MKVILPNGPLSLIETDRAAETGFSVAVIKSARRKLQTIRAAPDERTLRNWKSLHFEKLVGDRAGQYSIRLNDKWRMTFVMDKECQPHEVTVYAIENYHK
jgi:proteic killer suppression protein